MIIREARPGYFDISVSRERHMLCIVGHSIRSGKILRTLAAELRENRRCKLVQNEEECFKLEVYIGD